MGYAVDCFAGFDICVGAKLNKCGAWIADVKISGTGQPEINEWLQTVQPEWRTADEAIRDGIEWARRSIRQRFKKTEPHSWVAARERDTVCFTDTVEHPRRSVIGRDG